MDCLDQGSGRARISAETFDARGSYLVVSPKQRYSPRIKNWEFPIREQPQEGEYRYLRLAWKSQGADGVMVEFADDGRFPEDDKPFRSYHVGKNSTGWESHKLAAEASTHWTTVTIDLWQDNGDFTLTGIAFTAMGGDAAYDSIALFRDLDSVTP